MSNRQTATTGVRFEPVSDRIPRSPSDWTFLLGVIYPAAVIGIELLTRVCAKSFFDPMPTYWHALAVGFVPASNLLLWLHLEHGRPRAIKWLAFANGVAIAIAAFYTLLLLPFMPLALVAILIGIGLLPFAPLAALVCALRLRKEFRDKHKDQPGGRPLLVGLGAGLALLLALDVQPKATRLGVQWAASSVPMERERGLALLRTIGDDDLLLRFCYGAAGRPSVLVGASLLLAEGIGWGLASGGPRYLRPTPAKSITASTACPSTPDLRHSRAASRPAGRISSSTTTMAERRLAGG